MPVSGSAELTRAKSAAASRRPPLWKRYSFAFSLLLCTVLLVVNLTVQPDFGWVQKLAAFAPLALAAMASTPAVISGRGGLDVSISPLMIFVSVFYAAWIIPVGLDGPLGIILALAVGAALGAVNGVLIVYLRLQPVVVTLSMYFVITGLSLLIAPVPLGIGDSWIARLSGQLGPVPGGLVMIVLPLLLWAGFTRTVFGRQLYAVGSNDATALSSGLNVGGIRIGAYAMGGCIAAVGSFALLALVRTADPSQSTSYTLMAIAAVALGGTSLLGGRGGLIGSLLGAACIFLLQSLITTMQISQTWLNVFYGGLLLVAVVFGAGLNRKPVIK